MTRRRTRTRQRTAAELESWRDDLVRILANGERGYFTQRDEWHPSILADAWKHYHVEATELAHELGRSEPWGRQEFGDPNEAL